jgi:hypothetical protein
MWAMALGAILATSTSTPLPNEAWLRLDKDAFCNALPAAARSWQLGPAPSGKDLLTAWARAGRECASIGDTYRSLAALAARPEDPGAIRRLAAALDDKSSGTAIDALAELWIAREVDRMAAHPRRPAAPPSVTPPEWLRGAPDELRKAWASYASIKDAFDRRLATESHPRSTPVSQFNLAVPQRTILRFLKSEDIDLVHEAAAMYWSNNLCATGIEPFIKGTGRMRLMGLLHEHNYEAAAVAAMFDDAQRLQTKERPWVPRLLEAGGFDWEALYAGAILATAPSPSDFAAPDADYRRRIVEQGTLRAARMLLGMSRLPRFDTAEILCTLALFVAQGQPAPTASLTHGRMISSVGPYSYWPERTLTLDDAEQREVLKRLSALVGPDLPHDDLEMVVTTLGSLWRPEAEDGLRRALDLPDDRARTVAQDGLRALGVDVPNVVARPLTVRVRLNGAPLAHTKVAFQIAWGEPGAPSYATAYFAVSDDEGRVTLPRGELTDPKRKNGALSLSSVVNTANDPWFGAPLPWSVPPAGEEIPVDVTVAPLTLHVQRPDSATAADQRMTLVMWRAQYSLPVLLTLPVSDMVELPRVQAGAAHLSLSVPGLAAWTRDITVDGRTAVDVVLSR